MTEAHRTEDLVSRLQDESYCTSSDVWALRREAAATIEALRNHIFNGQDIIRTMFSQPENETAKAWAKEWAYTVVDNG